MESHNDAVKTIAAQVRAFNERKEPFRIYHGSTNSTRPSRRQRDQMVDISSLNNVLQVDAEAKFALVEAGVPMDKLVAATLRHGLVPPVVMEFPGITAGGGFAGTAGESSSFRYGFFDRTVSWIEIVLATGEVETASTVLQPDLLYGAAASFGTLGITTLLKVELKEAKTHVELSYFPVRSMSDAIEKFEQVTRDPSIDYVDGILFASNAGVVCAGRLTNEACGDVQGFSCPSDPWFYLHAQELLEQSTNPTVELVPLVDYLFRYDRGAFWLGAHAFKYFLTPFNRIGRWLLDHFMHTRVMYHALHKSGHSKQYIIQDILVPYATANDFHKYIDETLGCYPLWLCPIHERGQSQQAPQGPLAERPKSKDQRMLLNFGVWGPGPSNRRSFVETNRELEHKIQELEGRKWLYAHTYNTEKEFWEMYDRESYDALRAKYQATYLPSIYEKVKVDVEGEEKAIRESWVVYLLAIFWSIWPLSGLYGVYQATIGGDYLLSHDVWWNGVQKLKR
ncbi:hypothetical protein IMSHALPRED_010731 [Imshaugia aleurites]|uniref:Delta(24)-sterol reductase n=1 Tax=Imshaugia aleurites TaxID=172621 RepID=A0A8H3IWB2_9LECA|nr:hypothetical protein IMSHALPRED_010731 [Imshaugia aleurites]